MFCSKADFETNVLVEVNYSRTLHGEAALEFARARAARPNLRSWRRKVIKAAVYRLEREARPRAGFFEWLMA